MNKRIKKLWIKALRSGKYKQGKNALHPTPDTFCCLGVLCDLYRKQDGIDWEEDYGSDEFTFAGESDVLPKEVRIWAEIAAANPKLGVRTNARSAAQLNDDNKTFEYIADRIEKSL